MTTVNEDGRKYLTNGNGLYTVVRYSFTDGDVEVTYHEGCSGTPEEWAASHLSQMEKPEARAIVSVYESIMPVNRNGILERIRRSQEGRKA